MSFFSECTEAIQQIEINTQYIKFLSELQKHSKVILIGNGGSNAVASHISQDYVKFLGKKSLSFSDPSMLTCFINDFGMENAYRHFLQTYADEDTLVILISSSGESENMINCVEYCNREDIPYGILTAFFPNNPMREIAHKCLFDYHIETKSYGVAECVHQIFLHGAIS
jgi:D-sedoheptulose 7-phosphate isomerase